MGITRGVVEVGRKVSIGTNVEALNYTQLTSEGIFMKNIDYIPATIDGVAINSKATVPAAHFNTSTEVLTIFLP